MMTVMQAAVATPAVGPAMLGCRILITADRRADQMMSLFARHGATGVHVPAVSTVQNAADDMLIAATRRLIAEPPNVLVATTGIGFRGWMEAADAAGMGVDLMSVLRRTQILARGSKARGAVQAAGLETAWVAASETAAEVGERLLAEGVRGRRIAIQEHGVGDDDLTSTLSEAGAEVMGLVVYRIREPKDPAAVADSAAAVANGGYDAVCFTSAPAVRSWLNYAHAAGFRQAALRRLCEDVTAVAVGPVTAEPLRQAGVSPVVPNRSRLGAMVRELVEQVEAQALTFPTPAGTLVVRNTCAVLDHSVLPLAPASLTVLRLLIQRRGTVVTRQDILAALPGESRDEHAAEVAVSRLREGLGHARVIRTVVKRGYSLG